ncbi:MAG: hypothetical protein AB8G86_03340 [Saprospiraceae bacterium]
MKVKLILFLSFLANSLIFAQIFSPSGGGQGEEVLQDSNYQLLQTIPIKSTYLTTDNLQNSYVATAEGKIIKFDKKGTQQFEYNNNRLGRVGKIAVKNPLNILVYYPDLAVIIILDRTLSVIKELNLYDLDILAPKGIALANDNNIWVYDEITAVLKKLSPEGKILFESRNLNQVVQKQLSPSFLQEKNNEVYLSDTQNGLFIFDAFGQLKQTIPIKDIDQFQILDQQLLLWKRGQAFLLNQPILEDQLLPLPTDLGAVKMVNINGNLLYFALTDKLAIYLWQ